VSYFVGGRHGHLLSGARSRGCDRIATRQFAAEEHRVVSSPRHGLRVGDQVRVILSHAGGTMNLYRQLVVHEGERVSDVWPISATGYDQESHS
jgi:D-serine deaminase-like pyridoxal phosphate-dependent protein